MRVDVLPLFLGQHEVSTDLDVIRRAEPAPLYFVNRTNRNGPQRRVDAADQARIRGACDEHERRCVHVGEMGAGQRQLQLVDQVIDFGRLTDECVRRAVGHRLQCGERRRIGGDLFVPVTGAQGRIAEILVRHGVVFRRRRRGFRPGFRADRTHFDAPVREVRLRPKQLPVGIHPNAADEIDRTACQCGASLCARLEHPDLEAELAGLLDGVEIIRGNAFVQVAIAIQIERHAAVAHHGNPHEPRRLRRGPIAQLRPLTLFDIRDALQLQLVRCFFRLPGVRTRAWRRETQGDQQHGRMAAPGMAHLRPHAG
nr:hypothetical protein [Burkholderia ubonensis]